MLDNTGLCPFLVERLMEEEGGGGERKWQNMKGMRKRGLSREEGSKHGQWGYNQKLKFITEVP